MSFNSHALFQCLVSDVSGFLSAEQITQKEIWPDATLGQRACHTLVHSFYKKFVDKVSPDADKRALEKFEQVNLSCSDWSLRLGSSWDEVLVGELKDSLYRFFNPGGVPLLLGLDQFFDRGRTGPGASVGARGNDFYTKLFDSPLTATKEALYNHYRSRLQYFPRWADAENNRYARHGGCRVVEGSRLHFVPKTNDISRLICIEPSLNMFYQLGLGAVLEDRLYEVFSISLSDQPELNRELARVGSLDGRFDTIDLSSASDSLSLKMLAEVLPRDVMSWLRFLRSPISQLGDRRVELSMVSTMGNGFTFPLQTILFSCIVSASYRARDLTMFRSLAARRQPGNYGVFGDDIICHHSVTKDVLRLLELLGFQVNTEKTFTEGRFRESCGRDFFHGHDIRGFYVKSLRTMQDRYVAINGLNLWSAKTGISLPDTQKYLLSCVKHVFVPVHEGEDAGIIVPSFMIENLKADRHLNSIRYKRYQPRPYVLLVEEDGIVGPRSAKKRHVNPDGLMLAFLNGNVRSCKMALRLEPPAYRVKWSVTHNWDYAPTGSLRTTDRKSVV